MTNWEELQSTKKPALAGFVFDGKSVITNNQSLLQ